MYERTSIYACVREQKIWRTFALWSFAHPHLFLAHPPATSPNPFPLPIRPHHDNDGCDVAPTSTAAVATTKDDGNDGDGENEDEGGRRRSRVSNLSFLGRQHRWAVAGIDNVFAFKIRPPHLLLLLFISIHRLMKMMSRTELVRGTRGWGTKRVIHTSFFSFSDYTAPVFLTISVLPLSHRNHASPSSRRL